MAKKIKIAFILLLLIVVSATVFVACNNNENTKTTEAGFILQLHDSDAKYVFTQGKITYSEIVIDQISTSSGQVLATFYATEELLSKDDIDKLKTPGTYSVSFTYSGVSVLVTITIVPENVVNYYTVTYNAGLGAFTENSSNTMTSLLTQIDTLPIPVREGYEFGGWYLNTSYTGDKVIAPYALNNDIIVYAKWVDQRQFTVTFRSDVSQEVIARYESVEYGTRLIAPEAPEVEGYSFVGWRGSFDNITSDITVWAEYSRIKITVYFSSEVWSETYGDATKTRQLDYGETLEDPEALPAKTGYTGVWLDDETGKAPVYSNLTKDLHITATYTIITYTVNFYIPSDYTKNEGDTLTYTRTVNYNSTILQVPQVPTQVGYIGVWQEYYNGRLVDADLTQNVSSNISVYARYSKRIYTITYNYVDSDGKSKTTREECTYGTVLEQPELEIDPKYYSIEWYNAQTYAADKLVSFPYTVTSSVSFYMKKIAHPYRVDFCIPDEDTDGNAIEYYYGDKIMRTVYVTPGAAVTAPTMALKKYDLIGWIDATTGSSANFDSITDFHEYNADGTKDHAFYAVLKVKIFTIDFYNMVIEDDGGIDKYTSQIILPAGKTHFKDDIQYDTLFKELPDETDIVKPTYPDSSEDDFEFVGWFTTEDFSTAAVDFETGYVITQNVCFYAKWIDKNKGSEELIYAESEDGNSYIVVGYDYSKLKYTTVEQVSIPRSYSPASGSVKAVTGVAENAFEGAETVKIQEIEFTVVLRDVASNAFASCKYLTGFSVKGKEDGITDYFHIVDGVLYSADHKTLYKYPNGKDATSFQVPNDVETIEGGAFTFSKLSSVVFDQQNSKLKVIGNGAFSAMGLINSISLPEKLTTIEADAFRDSIFLTYVDIPEVNSLTEVGELAFSGTQWWINSIKNDKKVVIGNVLLSFNDYTATSLDISEYVAIADGALGGSDPTTHSTSFAIKSLIVGETSNLTQIGKYAFSACTNLTSITISSSQSIIIDATSFDGIARNAKLYVTNEQYTYYSTQTSVVNHFGIDNISKL